MNTTVKATLGAALFAVCAEASMMSSYAAKRVNESRHHLEKVYGKGLIGMFNSQG